MFTYKNHLYYPLYTLPSTSCYHISTMQLAFFLGHAPLLSAAEITTVLLGYGKFKILAYAPAALVVDVSELINIPELQGILGGTIKIGRVVSNMPVATITPSVIAEQLANIHAAITAGESKKFHFGFSVYPFKGQAFKLPRNFGLAVKTELQHHGLKSVRHVVSNEPVLSSVTVTKNKLLAHGAELCFLPTDAGVYIIHTQSVQPFASYSERDYGRPGRDARSGMLPPKVAQIMINLAVTPKDKLLLDPFCGSGTVLTEALLLGYRHIAGADLSDRAAADSKQNITFIQKQYQLTNVAVAVSVGDARKLSARYKPASVGAIVTEPYLGPAQRGNETPKQLADTKTELVALYQKAFMEFAKVLRQGGRVVNVFPVLRGKPIMDEPQLRQIEKLGFKRVALLPKELAHLLTARQSLVYRREGQKVEREVFGWEKR